MQLNLLHTTVGARSSRMSWSGETFGWSGSGRPRRLTSASSARNCGLRASVWDRFSHPHTPDLAFFRDEPLPTHRICMCMCECICMCTCKFICICICICVCICKCIGCREAEETDKREQREKLWLAGICLGQVAIPSDTLYIYIHI